MELLEVLRELELFQDINKFDIEKLSDLTTLINYDVDEIIIEESSIDFDLYILLEGRLTVSMKVPSNKKVENRQITILKPGSPFGEITFLEGMRRSAEVKALDKVRAIKFDGEKLHSVLKSDFRLGFYLMRNLAMLLSRRIRDMNFIWRNQF